MYCLQFALVAVFIATVRSQGRFDCPYPWLSFEDSCYYFQLLPKDYDAAQAACGFDGATLVSVNNRAEHDFISGWIDTNDQLGNEWYTSGRRTQDDSNAWFWEGTGKNFEGDRFWINANARQKSGDVLLYGWDGSQLGWKIGNREMDEQKVSRPYICEIKKSQIYRIIGETRGYEYGSTITDPQLYQKGPHFTDQPQDLIYDPKGTDKFARMECVAEANPVVEYSWFHTKDQRTTQISINNDKTHTIINGRLIINDPVDIKDNGDYHCIAENKYGSIISNTAQLSFGYLLEFPKSTRDPVSVQAYYGIGIECNPPNHGYPYLLYSWFKESDFIRPALKPYIFISRNGKLYFSSVTKDDVGEYHCLVSSPNIRSTNTASRISTPIRLEVSDVVASVHEPQLASGFPSVFPSSPKRGEDVQMECFAMGTDELTYKWERVGAPMPETAILTDYNRVLKIPKAELRHRGQYKCSVSRENGLSTSGVVQVPIEARPFFTIPLQNQHVDHNEDLEWRCIAEGIPDVTYTWYRNAKKLVLDELPAQDKARYGITHNVLTIAKVDPVRDSGMYQCAASNSHGTEFSSAELRVLSFPPSFTKFPLRARQYGSMGGNVTIICMPEGAPLPDKQWLKDGSDFGPSTDPNERVQVLPNGNLLLTRIEEGDQGNYTCVATNTYGQVTNSTKLTVINEMVISQEPLDNVAELGKTAFIRCEASYNPVLDITYDWYQNDYKIPFIRIQTLGQDQIYIERDPNFRRGGGINAGGLYILSPQFDNTGDYTCVAKTTTTQVSRSAHLRVVGPPSQPAGIYGEAVTTNTIVLKWGETNDNGGDILEYRFEKVNLDEGIDAWKSHPVRMTFEEVKARQVKLTGLDPWSFYKFRVHAVNKYGAGSPSVSSNIYQTLEDKPSQAPAWVGGGGGKVGTLVMKWTPVPKEFQNGDDFEYIVKWKEFGKEDQQWDMVTVKGAEKSQFVKTVGSVNFYKRYDITVSAKNKIGMGPEYGKPVVIRSAEDIPNGVPLNVRASQINATALRVEWIQVEDTIQSVKGKLKGYRINYWKEQSEDEEMSIYRLVYGQRDYGDIVGLDPDTQYQVNVQVINTAGNGPKSQNFLQKTLRAAPLYAPTEVSVDVLGYSSIKVKYRGVSTSVEEEPLEGYMVRIWRVGENLYVAKDYDARRGSRIEIHDLEVDTLYNLRVYGYSRGGQGLMSSPGIQFYLRPFCVQLAEEAPDKDYIYKCRGQTDAAVSMLPSILVLTGSLLFLLQLVH